MINFNILASNITTSTIFNINSLCIEHKVSDLGVERDSDKVGLALELGQVVVLVLDEDLDDDKRRIAGRVVGHVNVARHAFADVIGVVGRLHCELVVGPLLPVQLLLRVDVSVRLVDAEPSAVIAGNDVIVYPPVLVLVRVSSLHPADKVARVLLLRHCEANESLFFGKFRLVVVDVFDHDSHKSGKNRFINNLVQSFRSYISQISLLC